MSKKVLLATEKAFSNQARDQVVGILKEAGYTAVVLESYKGKEPLMKAVADVDAMIVRSDIVDPEVLEAAKKLKLCVRAGAGYDNIDCAKAKEKGVAVMNTPGQNANAVAELAVGLMIYMARDKFSGKTGFELRGKRLGIHAIGATGRGLARAAKGFDMKVRAFDPFVSEKDMHDLGGAGQERRRSVRAERLRVAPHARQQGDQEVDRQGAHDGDAQGRHARQHRASRAHQRGGAAAGARGAKGPALRERRRADRADGGGHQGEVRGPRLLDAEEDGRADRGGERQRGTRGRAADRRLLRARRAQVHRQRLSGTRVDFACPGVKRGASLLRLE